MNWQDFFKLSVSKTGKKGDELFFEAQLKTPTHFAMHELVISRFQHLKLSSQEKKKLSLDLRKIILCHQAFQSHEFHKICRQFKAKIESSPEQELIFSTQGGGIYLFLNLLSQANLKNKKIICYTSELPLPVMSPAKKSQVQFIYRPHGMSYLSDFSTLWKESDLMSLFELKDFKASA